ncbi:MAG TPA: tRNA epoxyqueuosine(34) reductase QueG [Candidatus Atribacteria bacterium]|nr:tRNA epoxyqueuosine(34) reductase QueG [Candidatus Atribacteria bacterium]
MPLASQIKEFGKEIGLDVIRITNAEGFPETEKRIIESVEKGYIPENDYYAFKNISERPNNLNLNKISKRCNPKSILKRAKSIISVAQSYFIEETEDITNKDQPLGKIAKYDVGNFYYDVKLKLKKIVDFINQKTDFKYKSKNKSCYVSLVEKPIAERAGVGWYGKHGIIVTERFGSWVVLGEIITELDLETDTPLQRDCGNCTICIDSCPTQAIVSPYTIDRTRCLQYISERPMKVPLAFREVWGDRLYGCTTCQEVCPQNRKVKLKKYKPEYGYIGLRIPLIPLLTITQEEFQDYFAYNQIAIRSRKVIKRNAALALGNIGDPRAVVPLIKVLREDANSIVREHAAWALGKIGGEKAKSALEKALNLEEEREVREEILNALKML